MLGLCLQLVDRVLDLELIRCCLPMLSTKEPYFLRCDHLIVLVTDFVFVDRQVIPPASHDPRYDSCM